MRLNSTQLRKIISVGIFNFQALGSESFKNEQVQ
jgi:hypothetical protein